MDLAPLASRLLFILSQIFFPLAGSFGLAGLIMTLDPTIGGLPSWVAEYVVTAACVCSGLGALCGMPILFVNERVPVTSATRNGNDGDETHG
jgi:hypothetical protein